MLVLGIDCGINVVKRYEGQKKILEESNDVFLARKIHSFGLSGGVNITKGDHKLKDVEYPAKDRETPGLLGKHDVSINNAAILQLLAFNHLAHADNASTHDEEEEVVWKSEHDGSGLEGSKCI